MKTVKMNFKQDPPLEVKVMSESAPVTYESFRKIFGVTEEPAPVEFAPSKGELNEFTKSLLGNKIQRFKNIMIRGENGCQQLNYAYENQDSISEPLWWSALTVAKVQEIEQGGKPTEMVFGFYLRFLFAKKYLI